MNILEITLTMGLIGMIQVKKSFGSIDIGMKKTTTYKVYMVECSDKSIYTGITTDINRRLHEHANTNKGSKYVRRRLPIQLVWSSHPMSHSEALQLEYRIKQWKREQKLQWIRLNNE